MNQKPDTKRPGIELFADWSDAPASTRQEASATQQIYAAIVDSTDDAVMVFDTDGRITLWNRAAVALFGYTFDEAIGQSADLLVKPLAYIPPGETSRGAFDIVLTGESFQRDTKRVAKDGTVIDVSVTASQVTDPSGRLIGVSSIMRDIRYRKRCEAALRANEEGLRLALEAGGGGAWYLDIASDTVIVSAPYRVIYGFPADAQVTPDVWLSAIHPGDRRRLLSELDELFRSGGVYEQQFRIIHPERGVRWLRGSGRLELDAMGRPAQFYGIDIDITRQKEVESELRQQREDLDTAQAVAHTGSWRLDVNRNELTWSAENHRIFGVPETTPMTYELFLSIVHPDDRDYVDRKWKAGLTGELYDIEHRIIADGRVKWVRERATLEFDAGGRLIGGFGTTQDITDRKLAADELERMRQLLTEGQRIAQLGSWEYIVATQETVWSEEEKRIYGLDPADESPTYEVMLSQYIHPQDAAELDQSFGNALKEGASFENENRIIRPDGTVRWILNRACPFFDLEGNLEKYVGVTLDITERKEMFDVLKRANTDLEIKVAERTAALATEMKVREAAQERLAHAQRLEAAGRLAGGLAHDFNNTLAAIAAHLEFAEARIEDTDAAESVRSALDAVELGASLNRRLLSVAASRNNPPAIAAMNVPLEGVLSLITRTLGRDIHIKQLIDPNLWLARFDLGELECAVLNLAINARDAMPTGGTLDVVARTLASTRSQR